MEALRRKISQQATLHSEDFVNVDSFLGQQVDTLLLGQMADALTHRMDLSGVTKVLTAEASGIALATVCAYKLGLPMVYAKKVKTEPSNAPVYKSTVFSFTYGRPTTFVCDAKYLTPEDNVLIIDDFLAGGHSMQGLVDIVRQSGAGLAGIVVAIEKKYEGGGDRLRAEGYLVEALATIEKADENGFTFA